MTRWRSIADFLALRRNTSLLLVALVVAGTGEKLWLGFNDARGRYQDNHLGKGLRHEFDPLWVRIEVVRIIVD